MRSENVRAAAYAEGVRAAEARFRPDGKVTFSEVALCVERQINRFPPDKHEFIHKMALYATADIEPTPKQGKFLFDIFMQYLGREDQLMPPQAQANVPTELEAALAYANAGIPVFPCNPLDKKPLTPHGFKDATRDEAQIRSMVDSAGRTP